MTTTDIPWADLTITERTSYLKEQIATLRKAWPHLDDPTNGSPHTGPRPHPGSRLPTNVNTLSLRAEITDDLAYWAHELYEDRPESRTPNNPLDIREPLAVLAHLNDNALWIAGWEYGSRLTQELTDHAHDAKRLAWPDRHDTVLLGPCPNTIGVDGTPVPCGTTIRARRHDPGIIRCKGCGLTDTVDGWLTRIVGTERPVTAEQLVPILHARLGVRVKPATIRQWKARGQLTPITQDDNGRDLFDRRDALTLISLRDARTALTSWA